MEARLEIKVDNDDKVLVFNYREDIEQVCDRICDLVMADNHIIGVSVFIGLRWSSESIGLCPSF